ncbi:MAG: response regulator [Nitrospirae bacterium]|nr:response regulator [Candidatus Manganitrophaceae bacterium]
MPRRVLLIDDNLAVQKLVELTLRKEGYEITSIDNGLSALDLAFKNQPDLILADYNLEGMNIFTFVQKIRQRGSLSDTPIILLINSTESYDPAQLQSAGIQAFLKKPIDSRELAKEVKRHTGTAETVMMQPASVQLREEKSLSEHFSNPGGEAVKIEELLGWSSPGSLTDELKDRGSFEQALEPATPSIENLEPPSDEMGEETQMFIDPAALQPPPAPVEQQISPLETDTSLEETRYFQEPPPMPPEEPDLLEQSLPEILSTAPLESMQEASDSLETEIKEPAVPALSDVNSAEPAPPSPPPPTFLTESAPMPPVGQPQVDRQQIDALLQKNIVETVEKVVWEVLPGLLQSALTKAELKQIIEKVAWEVIPPLAETEIKEEIKRLQEE